MSACFASERARALPRDRYRVNHGASRHLSRIHIEISKAMEGERKDSVDKELPLRRCAEARLARALMLILSYAGDRLDIGGGCC